MKTDTSARLFDEARAVIPGGVDSPVRAPRGMDAARPHFPAHGPGAHVRDVDGNEFMGRISSPGPMIVAAATQVSGGGAA